MNRDELVAKVREAMLDAVHQQLATDTAGILAAAAVDAVLEATIPDEVWEWKNQ